MNPILQQTASSDETISSAAEFFHLFDIGKLFARSARSKKGIPAFKILQFLFALVFLKKSFFEMMREKSLPWSKDSFYRFLSAEPFVALLFRPLLCEQEGRLKFGRGVPEKLLGFRACRGTKYTNQRDEGFLYCLTEHIASNKITRNIKPIQRTLLRISGTF